MRRRAALFVAVALLGTSCTGGESDDSTDASAPTGSVVIDPATGEIEPLVETGTFTVTVEVAEGTSPITVADRLDQLLGGYPGAKRASVDGSIVTAVVEEFPRDDSLTFEFTMRAEPVVALHPVLACADEGGVLDAVADEALVLSGETVGECALGPTPFERIPFTDASVIPTLDLQVTVDVDPEQIDEFNALTSACFDATEICPSRQLALVADGQILTAPVVNIAEFPTTLSLTGEFTDDQAEGLAESITLDRFTGEFVSVQYDYAPDA